MIVRYEDGKWIYNIGVYFDILRNLNDDLNKLINYNPKYNENIEILFFSIVGNINRLFPIRRRRPNFNDGILTLKEYFDFLRKDYNEMYSTYKEEIRLINDMRDKFEHVPHIIKWHSYLGNDKLKQMEFINDEYNLDIIEGNEEKIREKEENHEYLKWEIDTMMLTKIIVSLNKVFLKIQ